MRQSYARIGNEWERDISRPSKRGRIGGADRGIGRDGGMGRDSGLLSPTFITCSSFPVALAKQYKEWSSPAQRIHSARGDTAETPLECHKPPLSVSMCRRVIPWLFVYPLELVLYLSLWRPLAHIVGHSPVRFLN